MATNVYVSLISIVLYAAIMISIPFRIKKYGKKAVTDKKSFIAREIGIFVFSFILCLLCLKFEFGLISDIALSGCGVLGAYIGSKEILDDEEGE